MTPFAAACEDLADKIAGLAGGALSAEDARMAAEIIRRAPENGQQSAAWRYERAAEQDAAIHALAMHHCPKTATTNAKAETIITWARRYEHAAWQRTKGSAGNPHPDSSREALLWRAFQALPRFPAKSTITKIINTSRR